MQPSYSPDGRYLAATRTTALGTDVVILDAGDRQRAAAGHRRRRLVRPDLVAGRRRDRLPAHRRPDRRPAAGQARRRGPAWTVRETIDLTEVSGLDAGVAAGLVHPGRAAAGDAAADRGAERVRRPGVGQPGAVIAATGGGAAVAAARGRRHVPRAPRRAVAATGTVLCLGLDPDPSALPPGFAHGLAGLERFAALLLEAALPHAAAVKPNLAFFEAYGSRRDGRPGAAARDASRPTCRSSPTRSAATSGRRPRARRSRCSTCSGRTP